VRESFCGPLNGTTPKLVWKNSSIPGTDSKAGNSPVLSARQFAVYRFPFRIACGEALCACTLDRLRFNTHCWGLLLRSSGFHIWSPLFHKNGIPVFSFMHNNRFRWDIRFSRHEHEDDSLLRYSACSLGVDRRFRLRTASIFISLMMEAVRTSETSIYFNEPTRCCILEGYHLKWDLWSN
jgi:hypothetical protein